MESISPAALLELGDDALLEAVGRQTFRFFWEGAEPASLMARDRSTKSARSARRSGRGRRQRLWRDGAGGGGGAGLGDAGRRPGAARQMLDVLERAERHHGAYPHFLHGETGKTIPFGPLDDGGDLVETALLMMGLLTARQYFADDAALAARITALFDGVEWDWYRQGENVLYWHWSPGTAGR